MRKRFFITATGTDIGKTFVTAALARQAKALGRSVMVYKPVISGFAPLMPEDSDTGLLLRSLDFKPTPENIERISPWRYAAPLAPSMAARLEGNPLDFDALIQWGQKTINGPEDVVLIEGVGGVMAPMNDSHTVLDWIKAADIPALLVTGTVLGTISHTLAALMVLEQREISVAGLIVNESAESSVPLTDTANELARWTKVPVFSVARREGKDGWADVGELQTLLK